MELRANARERRRALACADPDAGPALAAQAFGPIEQMQPRTVGGYWPLEDEIDPRPLMHRLAGAGVRLALPCVTSDDAPLAFRRWRPGEPLRAGHFRVMEPEPEAEAVRPDLLLVPMLAFDREGYRLGYGGGYYDRTIAAIRSGGRSLYTIGLAFAGQEAPRVPREAHDKPLDLIATEAGLIRLKAADSAHSGEESL